MTRSRKRGASPIINVPPLPHLAPHALAGSREAQQIPQRGSRLQVYINACNVFHLEESKSRVILMIYTSFVTLTTTSI